jgi:FkbM family methyltransferase
MIKKVLEKIQKEIRYRVRKIIKPDDIELYGIKLNISHPGISNNLRNFFYNESYEGHEIRVLQKVLDKKDMVMEIGAGIGFLSSYCSKKIGSDRVVAYEANPLMIDKIQETYRLNNVNPKINNIVLMDKEGETSFYLEKDFWSSSMIKRTQNAKEVKVKTANINDEIRKYKINFLIIDIEGGEQNLLPKIDFSNIDKLLIEFHPSIIGNESVSDLIKLLLENRFCFDLYKSEDNICYFEKQ